MEKSVARQPLPIPGFGAGPRLVWRGSTLRSLVLAFGVTVTAFLFSRALRFQAGDIAPLWLPDAVLLAQAMVAARRQRYAVLAGGALGSLCANLMIGRSLMLSLGFCSADLVEVGIALMSAPHIANVAQLLRPRTLFRFVAGGIVLAPLVSGVYVTVLLGKPLTDLFQSTLVPWFVSDGLSLAILTPAAMVCWSGEALHALRSGERLKTGALVLFACGVIALIFAEPYWKFPVLYWAFPPIVVLAFNAEMAAALIGVLLCSATALGFSLFERGPFWAFPFESMSTRILALQLYLLATIALVLPICATQAQRKRLIARLSESERSYRLLAEQATDIVMSMQLDGRLTYISPRAFTVLGFAPGDLVGRYYADLLAEEDRAALAAAIEHIARGAPEEQLAGRLLTGDGRAQWMETNLRLVLDPLTGKPESLTATVRDITSRKIAEQRLAQERTELEGLVFRDALTGVFNRRHFDLELELLWRHETQNEQRCMGVIMVDVDVFKNYNDHYGHQSGDDCLRAIAQALSAGMTRAGDIVARYGGEEFALILKDTDEAAALECAEALRLCVEALQIEHAACRTGTVTISMGVATQRPAALMHYSDVVAAADRALYAAKRLGRNRTCVAQALP